MKLAYADPPYLGYAKQFYGALHPEAAAYDTIDAHRDLVNRLVDEFDGWAVSMTSGNLHDILPLFPHDARIAAWVKPFASFKPGISPGYTWEPIVFKPTDRKHDRSMPTIRDYIACNITLKKGLTGAKPEAVCSWILDLLRWQAGDEVTDVFPGTGIFADVTRRREAEAIEAAA